MELNVQPIEIVFLLLGALNGFFLKDLDKLILNAIFYIGVGFLTIFAIKKMYKTVIILHIITIIVFSLIIAPEIISYFLNSFLRYKWLTVCIPATIVFFELVVHIIALAEAISQAARHRLNSGITITYEEVNLRRWLEVRQNLITQLSFCLLTFMGLIPIGVCIELKIWIAAAEHVFMFALLLIIHASPFHFWKIFGHIVVLFVGLAARIEMDRISYPESIGIARFSYVVWMVVVLETCIEGLIEEHKKKKKQENRAQLNIAEENV